MCQLVWVQRHDHARGAGNKAAMAHTPQLHRTEQPHIHRELERPSDSRHCAKRIATCRLQLPHRAHCLRRRGGRASQRPAL